MYAGDAVRIAVELLEKGNNGEVYIADAKNNKITQKLKMVYLYKNPFKSLIFLILFKSKICPTIFL